MVKSVLLLSQDAALAGRLREWYATSSFRLHIAQTPEDLFSALENRGSIRLVVLHADKVLSTSIAGRIRTLRAKQTLPILWVVTRTDLPDVASLAACDFDDILYPDASQDELLVRTSLHIQRQETLQRQLADEIRNNQPHFKPHFVFNALSVIISLCHDEGPRAGQLLTEFSNYLRMTYATDADRMDVPLERELSLIHSYVAIEKARFGERVEVTYDIDAAALDCQVPALILQPLVEYAIRRGILKRLEGGTVKLSIHHADHALVCRIQDDGPGSEEAAPDASDPDRKPDEDPLLQTVRYRLRSHLQQELNVLRIPGQGTEISFGIPVQ